MIKYRLGKFLFKLSNVKKIFISYYLNRYYYENIKKIGKCVRFNGISRINGLNNIEIGNNVHIGDNAFISGIGGVYIGDNTHISRNVVIYSDNHNYEGKRLPYDDKFFFKKVIIEKNVWIGVNVTILPGTHIEEGAIIGAGAVVSGRIPKYSVYGASLGKIIKYRNIEHYKEIEKDKRYGGINGKEIDERCM